MSDIFARQFANTSPTTIGVGHTHPWDREFRSRPRQALRPWSIDINCQSVIESHRNRFSAVCTTIIAWERRPLSDGSYFLRTTADGRRRKAAKRAISRRERSCVSLVCATRFAARVYGSLFGFTSTSILSVPFGPFGLSVPFRSFGRCHFMPILRFRAQRRRLGTISAEIAPPSPNGHDWSSGSKAGRALGPPPDFRGSVADAATGLPT